MGSWWQCTACLRAQEEDISELQLNHYNLYDVPPDVFIYERTLEKLYLDANRIKDLPRPLFQCHELRVLSLSDNEITNLPPAIASLINLEHLDLSKNSIKELPDNIKECKNLRSIDLSVNPFERFPESITHITGLRELYINDAYIEYLPANFGRLSGLKTLELRENNMMTLPKSMSRLVNLQRLDIGNNDFTELPEVVGDLINLTELWIDGNDIRRIPVNIEQLYRLNHFDCTMNSIDTIPSEIEGWRDISIINFSSNEILQLPDTLCYLRTIVTLKIDDNQLNSLPVDIGQMSNLEELIVTKNFLETLPSSIGLLRKLHCLNADNNYLRYLPSEIGSCCALSLLSLRSNNLTTIPPEVGHLSSLCVFNLVNNCIQFLPVSMLNLTNLKALWLSDNQSQPLVPLQQEFNQEQDMMVLSCFMLPQKQRKPLEQMDHAVGPISGSIVGTGRKICFAAELDTEVPRQLHRAPTPYPKELRNLAKHARNLHHQSIHDQKANLENQSIIKEAIVAKATLLLNNSTRHSSNENGEVINTDKDKIYNEISRDKCENEPKNDLEECSKPILAQEKSLEIREAKCIRNPTSENICKSPTISDYVSSTWKPDEYSKTNTAKIVESEKLADSKSLQSYDSCKLVYNKETPSVITPTPPLEPPPYHIAAAFSKKAALFQQLNQFNMNQEPSYHDNQLINQRNGVKNTSSNSLSASNNINDDKANKISDSNDQLKVDQSKTFKNISNKDEKSSKIPIMREKKVDLSSNNCDNNLNFTGKNIYTCQDNNLNIHPTSPITGKKYRSPISNTYSQLRHTDKSYKINPNYINQNNEQNYKNCLHQNEHSSHNSNTNDNKINGNIDCINNSYNTSNNSQCSTPTLSNNNDTFFNSDCSKNKSRIKWMFGPHRNVNVILVQIKKNPGLGFSISGGFAGNETGIIITKVNPDGPAQGSLYPGDKILEVDGVDLSKSDHNIAVTVLKSTGPIVSMMISRNL